MTSESDQQAVFAAWKNAIEIVPPSDNAKALLAGVKVRVNIRKLLTAVWHTATFVLHLAKVQSTGVATPADFMGFAESISAIIATGLAAFRETMTPAEYYACVMLSRHEGPCPEARFEDELHKFITDATGVLPWYLGLNAERASSALTTLRDDGADAVLEQLAATGMIKVTDGNIDLHDRTLVWGFRQNAEAVC